MPGPELEVAHNMPVQGRARQGAGNGELAFHLQHLAAVLRQDDGHTPSDVGRGGNRVGKMEFNTTTRQTFR